MRHNPKTTMVESPTIPQPEVTAGNFIERTDKNVRVAMADTIELGIQKFDSGVTRIGAGAKEMVSGVNEVFDAGRDFDMARDLNQFEFRQRFDNTADWKVEAIRREKVNCGIKVYEAMKDAGRAKKLSDCPKAVQIILAFAQLVDKPKKQIANPEDDGGGEVKNPWNRLTSLLSDFETQFGLIQDGGKRTLNEMSPEELDKLVRTTEPIAKVHNEAQEILQVMGAPETV